MHPFPLVDLSTKQFGPGLRGNSPGLCPVFIKNITRNSSQFLRKKRNISQPSKDFSTKQECRPMSFLDGLDSVCGLKLHKESRF